MKTWFTLNLGDAMLAAERMENIKQQFQSEYLKPDHPHNMAIFMRHESPRSLHCELILYFSPGTTKLAKELGADSCAEPATSDLTLLAGATDI